MSASNCLRCLVGAPAAAVRRRLAPLSLSTTLAQRSISTTPVLARTDSQNKNLEKPKKQKKNYKKSTAQLSRGKPPAPGERKAYRKRILLSNNNALPVEGLPDLNSASMLDASNAGKVLAIPSAVVDQLRAIDAFKPTQTWGMFRQPSMLLRAETIDLVRRMHHAVGKKETLRLVIAGDRLSGKSMLLLQAMTHAYMHDWIVFNVPEAQELSTACTEYARIPDTDPVLWMQHAYALKMIQNIRTANQVILSQLKTVRPHPDLAQHIPVGSPVLQLAANAKEADTAWPVFQALWQELTLEGHGRPPILFCLDGLSHVMKVSDYRSPSFELIHSHDLALVRLFNDCLAGSQTLLPNGGAAIAATTRGNAPRSASMDLALARREAEQNGTDAPVKDPYGKSYDPRVEDVLKTVDVMRLQGISKLETRAVMEYWAASGLLRETVDERNVSEKWTLGGNGILGEIERATLLHARL